MNSEKSGMDNIHTPGAIPLAIKLYEKPIYRIEPIQIPGKRPRKRMRRLFRFIAAPFSRIYRITCGFFDRSFNLLLDLYESGLLYVILTLLISIITLFLSGYIFYSLRDLHKEIRENKTFSNSGDSRLERINPASADEEFSSYNLKGFIMPIEGARIPDRSSLLPNARREYRNGTHEGIDFFVPYGTPVIAAKAGWVIHADGGYREPDKGFRDMLLKTSSRLSDTPRDIEDILLGRYVILDHGFIGGHRVTTVYAHLDSIEDGLTIGSYVRQGALIGKVGNSGTSSAGTKEGAHLHFELRVNNTYLGKGLSTAAVKRVFNQIFEDQGREQIASIDKDSLQ